MRNLKRLNLILDLEDEFDNIDGFLNDMNVSTCLETLIINYPYSIDCDKLKVPFGTRIELK